MRWVNRNTLEGALDLSVWYCGVTHVNNSPLLEQFLKKNEGQNIYFRKWLANDSAAAIEIQKFFIKNGMQTRPPAKGELKPDIRFVFTFKTNPLMTDELLKFLT